MLGAEFGIHIISPTEIVNKKGNPKDFHDLFHIFPMFDTSSDSSL